MAEAREGTPLINLDLGPDVGRVDLVGGATHPDAGLVEKTYRVNEIFYSLQGEGVRAGEPSLFLRFTGCNLRCSMEPGPKSPGGFDCDTEFTSGIDMPASAVIKRLRELSVGCRWVVCTGGEPALQLDRELVQALHDAGYKVAVETNGSVELPACPVSGPLVDWITVSPKVAEHCIRQLTANEVKYVRGYGQGVPKTVVKADHYVISPAFDGLEVAPETLAWCVKLCRDNPPWRLSMQLHKLWRVR